MNVCRSIGYVMVAFGISVGVYFLSIGFRLIRAILSISATGSERKGNEKIFASGVKIHGKEAEKESKSVLSDTTVQQNNTTFPTDAKLSKKVIDKCNTIAEKEGINGRRRYTGESKQLLRDTYNGTHPKRAKKAKKAKKRLKTIAGTQIRELERKMSEEQKKQYGEELELYKRAVNQKKKTWIKFTAFTNRLLVAFPKGNPTGPMSLGTK